MSDSRIIRRNRSLFLVPFLTSWIADLSSLKSSGDGTAIRLFGGEGTGLDEDLLRAADLTFYFLSESLFSDFEN